MIRAAALALVLALAAAPDARAADDLVTRATEELTALEQRAAALEATALAGLDEGAAARAARRAAGGERRFRVGDLAGAAAALQVAVDDPQLRRSKDLAPALFQLAEALRRLGRPAAALARYQELLRLEGAPFRREALPRAMECALQLRRPADAERILGEAVAATPPGDGAPPAEAVYLAAKAAYRRVDRPAAERWPAALAAARRVPAPWNLHGAYLEGAIEVQRGALAEAEAAFGRCVALDAREAVQQEVRELCRLALGRIAADQGRYADADRHYREVSRRSPRFAEALQEHAGAAVRAGRLDDAVRLAGLLPDLQPESQLAPRSALLRGQLLLRLGGAEDAVQAFQRVVTTYAPLRDDLDGALAGDAPPAAWYAALAGPAPGRPDPPRMPRIALRWAKDRDTAREVLAAAATVEDARREAAEARRRAQRAEGMLSRNYGIGAFPALEDGYARAEVIETAALRIAGALAALEAEAMAPAGDAALAAARAERRALEARLAKLPRDPAEMAARQKRDRERFSGAARELVELKAALQSAEAAVDDVDVALFARPAALGRDRAGAQAELAAQRRVLAADLEELDRLADRVARAADGAPRAGRRDEDRLRAAFRAAVDRELELASQAAARLSALPAIVARADRVRGRAGELEARADRAKRAILKDARVRAGELRAQLAEDQRRLDEDQKKLEALRGEAERTIGRAAKRVFHDVRRRLHEVVLQADVGIVDVAWTEKQRGLERMQATSVRHAEELRTLEREVAKGYEGGSGGAP